jgi:hypothetical protein
MPDTASPSERLARSLDILALGHHLGRDGAAIEVLIGNSVAKGALDQLDPLITKLSPKDSALLAVELRKLPPLGTLSTALAYEKTFFIDNLTRELTEELARSLAKPSPTDSASPHSTLDAAFSRRLADFQMLGLTKEGPVTRVGLSSPIGNFWLTPGETRQGLTLLSVTVTPDRANALLMVENRPVVLNLAKGTFGIPAMEVLEAAARALSSPSLTGLLLKARPAGTMADLFNEIETSVREVSLLYNEAIEHPERFTDDAAFWKRVNTLPPTAKSVVAAIPALLKPIQAIQTRESALLAKLDAKAAAQPSR